MTQLLMQFEPDAMPKLSRARHRSATPSFPVYSTELEGLGRKARPPAAAIATWLSALPARFPSAQA
eukprot:1778934-Pleurochrysis_carterae.AAC.1